MFIKDILNTEYVIDLEGKGLSILYSVKASHQSNSNAHTFIKFLLGLGHHLAPGFGRFSLVIGVLTTTIIDAFLNNYHTMHLTLFLFGE